MKKYVYFVSYSWIDKIKSGIGCSEFTLPEKIKTFNDLMQIMESLKTEENFNSVVIINYKLMRIENE